MILSFSETEVWTQWLALMPEHTEQEACNKWGRESYWIISAMGRISLQH